MKTSTFLIDVFDNNALDHIALALLIGRTSNLRLNAAASLDEFMGGKFAVGKVIEGKAQGGASDKLRRARKRHEVHVALIGADLVLPPDYPALFSAIDSLKQGGEVLIFAFVRPHQTELIEGLVLRGASTLIDRQEIGINLSQIIHDMGAGALVVSRSIAEALLSARILPAPESSEVLSAAKGVRSGSDELTPVQVTRGALSILETQAPLWRLSERERILFYYIVLGFSQENVAELLHVSPSAVTARVRALYATLGVGSRTQACRRILDEQAAFS